MQDMLDFLKNIHINVPLLDAIKKMSTYVKFIKEFQKAAITLAHVWLSEEVNYLSKDKISFLTLEPQLSNVIGNICIEQSLVELKASINVLSWFFYDTFQLDELKTIMMINLMADRPIKKPQGLRMH